MLILRDTIPFRWWPSCCSGANLRTSELSTWLHKCLLHWCKSIHTT